MSPRNLNSRALIVLCAALFFTTSLCAQQPPGNRGVYLVFPFASAGASPRLAWLSEGLEELAIQALSAGGQQVYSTPVAPPKWNATAFLSPASLAAPACCVSLRTSTPISWCSAPSLPTAKL